MLSLSQQKTVSTTRNKFNSMLFEVDELLADIATTLNDQEAVNDYNYVCQALENAGDSVIQFLTDYNIIKEYKCPCIKASDPAAKVLFDLLELQNENTNHD